MNEYIRDAINKSIFDQTDDTTTPVSFRLPVSLSNELDELSLTLDRSRSFLITEFIKAGIKETNALLEEKGANSAIELTSNDEDESDNPFNIPKNYMLNTNYNNDSKTHMDMLKNAEAAAFCSGWKEYIKQLSKGDKVYLYQSGVGIVAVGKVTGDLIKSEHYGVQEDKYSRKLSDFKVGFKAISAKQMKELTGDGANFRRTMVMLSSKQASEIDREIEKRAKNTPEF